jgi:hypothetical protein
MLLLLLLERWLMVVEWLMNWLVGVVHAPLMVERGWGLGLIGLRWHSIMRVMVLLLLFHSVRS